MPLTTAQKKILAGKATEIFIHVYKKKILEIFEETEEKLAKWADAEGFVSEEPAHASERLQIAFLVSVKWLDAAVSKTSKRWREHRH